jgi:transposase
MSWITGDHLDRVLDLAAENAEMRAIERNLLLVMSRLLQRKINLEALAQCMAPCYRMTFIQMIAPAVFGSPRYYRDRALIITMHLLGAHISSITDFVSCSDRFVRKCIRRFRKGKYEALFASPRKTPKWQRQDYKDKLFEILHSPPGDYDINRTTWTIDLLVDVMAHEGYQLGKNYICRAIKSEGIIFRKTREVLTSNDPNYREKLRKITRTLRRLGPADRFFSIDEYGPVSIRERGGRRRVRRGEKPTVPQYQDSKGTIIITGALELCSNQITYFYSQKKDTEEMIKLLHLMLEGYWDCRRLYLSWDAASWHSSKQFLAEVRRVNSRKYRNEHQSPMIKLAPLPARAQFLNVIESVFGGLAQSVIHNSNYQSVDEAKAAIDRYVAERNSYFRANPRRAGNKIWGREQVPSWFSVSHNCKRPKLLQLNARR